jgi:ribosomal protein S7
VQNIRKAFDVVTIRRINLSIKHLIHVPSDKAFNKKKTITQTIAEEIIMQLKRMGKFG